MAAANDSMEVDVILVKLKSSDGKLFQFTDTEASCSSALKGMLDSTRQYINNNNSHCTGPYIHLQSIDSKVLSDIHQWCKMHCYNNQSSSLSNSPGGCSDPATSTIQDHHESSDWDVKFLNSFSELDLLKLMNAANFLDIKSLYDACCRLTATRWEGMKVDEIRKRYNIRSDFTSEEEIQMIQENKKLGLTE